MTLTDYFGYSAVKVLGQNCNYGYLESFLTTSSLTLSYIAGLGWVLIPLGVYSASLYYASKHTKKTTTFSATATRYLKDCSAKLPTGRNRKVYRFAYISNMNLVKVGKNLNFTEALLTLGISGAKNSLTKKYKLKYKKPKNLGLGKEWGIYSSYQPYAKALAIVLSCNLFAPEVNGSGYYGHYHDFHHCLHIWYGSKIFYFGRR